MEQRAEKREEKIEAKRRAEHDIVMEMIAIYCRRKHGRHEQGLCEACQSLSLYAAERIEKCPRMAEKTFCSACPVHCYEREQRAKIREVMRVAAPWMLFHRPMEFIRHVWYSRKV